MEQKPCRIAQAIRSEDLPITAGHVVRLIHAGKVKAQRIGKLWYIEPAALRRALVQP